MLSKGYFLNNVGNGNASEKSNVTLDGDTVKLSITTPLFIDVDNNVFLSKDKGNAYVYMNAQEEVIARMV